MGGGCTSSRVGAGHPWVVWGPLVPVVPMRRKLVCSVMESTCGGVWRRQPGGGVCGPACKAAGSALPKGRRCNGSHRIQPLDSHAGARGARHGAGVADGCGKGGRQVG